MLDRTDGKQLILALKKVSETLLQHLSQDIEAIDAEAVETELQQRQRLIAALAQVSDAERKVLQHEHTALINDTQKLGQQCIEALHQQGLALTESQRQVSHGRHLLQTYQPEAEQQSHFIEGDA